MKNKSVKNRKYITSINKIINKKSISKKKNINISNNTIAIKKDDIIKQSIKDKSKKKSKKNINNETKKKLYEIDVLSQKSIPQIINLTESTKIHNFYQTSLLNYLKTPFEKGTRKLPQNDYYTYINEKWFKYLKIDPSLDYLTKIDDFKLVQAKVYENIDVIIDDYIKNNSDTELGNELQKFYMSALTFNDELNSKNYLLEQIKYIDELRKEKNNLWKLLAYINKNDITNASCPFYWQYAPDRKDNRQYANYIYPRSFAFFDISYYQNTDDKIKKKYINKYKQKFLKHVEECFEFIGDPKLNSHDVLDVEKQLFSAMECKMNNEDPNFYNKIDVKEAYEKYNFNWEEYSKELGFESTSSFFITTSVSYLKCCSKLLNDNWNSDSWRSFWIWLVTRYVIRFTRNLRQLYYIFYGKENQGMKKVYPPKIASIMFVCYVFNSLIHNEYIDKYYIEKNVQYCKTMAENIRNIFKNIISRNTWLDSNTKEKALYKLNKLTMNIEPKKITTSDPLLNYNPNDFLGNINKFLEWRHNLFINNKTKEINSLLVYDFTQYPAVIVSRPSYLVNAQYVLNENALYIPLAYMQKPFLDLEERGIEYNLAYMGFTIAHEFSHSLDDLGSKYDYKGDLYDWWTHEDKEKYKKIQTEIIKQYEKFALRDKIKMNAVPTIGEDIADISGLTICEEYLRIVQIKNNNIPVINTQSYKDLYIYFTYQMKQRIQKHSLKYELITNPHPLDKYRANVPLARSIIFRTLYNVKKDDKMYSDNIGPIW